MSSDIDDDCELYAAPKRGLNPVESRGGGGLQGGVPGVLLDPRDQWLLETASPGKLSLTNVINQDSRIDVLGLNLMLFLKYHLF